ncbi:MAG TPA: sulfatase [Thermoanaerobaculia bacterium]|nr:sulfatase [Thermoanaerobaculia bacterium]
MTHDLAALLPIAEIRQASTALERPRTGRGSIYLPLGTQIDYYLDLSAGSELSLAAVAVRGASAGRLEIIAQEEGEPDRLLQRLEAGARAETIELPGKDRRLLRLSLRAEPAPVSGVGGLLIARPVVLAASNTADTAKPPATPAPRPSPARPNVIVYLVDTLRADRLGCYGYPKPVSPHLDKFARGATLFETAIAQASWTRPSVASVLTGLGPLAHGVQTLEDRLPEKVDTLAEKLRAAGYRTAAFSTNWHVAADTGFAQGFDDFLFFPQEPDSAAVNRRVLDWVDQHGKEPFFLYIHALDPHAPYDPPPDLRQRFAAGIRAEAGKAESLREIYRARRAERARMIAEISPLYDAEIAANDRSFGALMGALHKRGMFEGSTVVFVSDHGEELGDHQALGHARTLYAEVINVPLVIKRPYQARGERIARVAQHLDLVPTILAASGLRVPASLPGTDLFRPTPESRPAFAHLSYRARRGMAVVHDGWKWIEPWSQKFGPGPALYHGKDETEDLAHSYPVRSGYLASLVRAEALRGRRGFKPENAEMDEEMLRGLDALGYL